MISSVRGTVLAVSLDHAVIEVGGSGAIGLAVQAAPSTLATLRTGEQAQLHTSLVVREDSLTLFGFADADARELFVLLQTVSGIGPRLALAAIAVLEPDTLRAAIADGNIAVLTQVPGIGRKGAERLSLELRDKVEATPTPAPAATNGHRAGSRVRAEVVEALLSLGFAAKQAEQAVDSVDTDGADTSVLLRAALSTLGKSR